LRTERCSGVYIWAVAHADRGDSQAWHWGGIPPIWGAKKRNLLLDLEFCDDVWDIGGEKRMRHVGRVGRVAASSCRFLHKRKCRQNFGAKVRSPMIQPVLGSAPLHVALKHSPSAHRRYGHRPDHQVLHLQDREESRPPQPQSPHHPCRRVEGDYEARSSLLSSSFIAIFTPLSSHIHAIRLETISQCSSRYILFIQPADGPMPFFRHPQVIHEGTRIKGISLLFLLIQYAD